MGWIIENKDVPNPDSLHADAWNATNESWEAEDFDTFTDVERETLNLPIGGEWVQVPWNVEESKCYYLKK